MYLECWQLQVFFNVMSGKRGWCHILVSICRSCGWAGWDTVGHWGTPWWADLYLWILSSSDNNLFSRKNVDEFLRTANEWSPSSQDFPEYTSCVGCVCASSPPICLELADIWKSRIFIPFTEMDRSSSIFATFKGYRWTLGWTGSCTEDCAIVSRTAPRIRTILGWNSSSLNISPSVRLGLILSLPHCSIQEKRFSCCVKSCDPPTENNIYAYPWSLRISAPSCYFSHS